MSAAKGPKGPSPDESTYRNNPEIDARIDAFIKEHPKFWEHLKGMPRERLERTVVLNEVRGIERREKANEGVLKRLEGNPKLKAALETAVNDLPEGERTEALVRLARQAQRVTAPRRSETAGVRV